jgi:hypothetical protein
VATQFARASTFLGRRRVLGAAATVVVLAAAVASYAQFTGPGNDAGTPVSSGIGAVTITSPAVGPLSPQINPEDTTPVAVTVNNTGADSVHVAQITGAVATHGGCLGWWFTVAPIAPGTITPGEHTYSSSVVLRNTDGDQTACTSQKQTIDWTTRSVPLPATTPKPQVGYLGGGR